MTDLLDLPVRDGATWLGGRRRASFEVEDTGVVDQVVWVEQGSLELRMAQVVPAAAGPEAVLEALEMAMREPVQGEPGRPARVVVSDHAVKRHLEEHARSLQLHVSFRSDLPEVESALEFMDRMADSPTLTYLDREDADPAAVALLFEKAERLYEAEPWRYFEDVDFLSAEVDGEAMVLSVMGADETEYGLAVFDSPSTVQAFLDAPDEEKSSLVRLFLVLADAEEVGIPALSEAEDQEWPLVEGELYPMAVNPADVAEAMAGPRDLRLLCHLVDAVLEFTDRGWWQRDSGAETFTLGEGGPQVRLVWPVEGIVLPDEEEEVPAPPAVRPGRNEPCWCGSGRKYKRCHLEADERPRA